MTAEATIGQTMTRGGRQKTREEPVRRCIATGESGATDRLVRFVLSPDGRAVPDVAAKLPGRGAWLTADRALIDRAVKKRLFSRAFRQPVEVDTDLADRLEALLARRLIDTISLARRAGAAVTGAEKVRARLTSGLAAVLVQASDGADDGLGKVWALARAARGEDFPRIRVLNSTELGLAFGRDFAIHAALDAGGFAARARAEALRLSGLRDVPPAGDKAERLLSGDHGVTAVAAGVDDEVGPVGGTREQDDP